MGLYDNFGAIFAFLRNVENVRCVKIYTENDLLVYEMYSQQVPSFVFLRTTRLINFLAVGCR